MTMRVLLQLSRVITAVVLAWLCLPALAQNATVVVGGADRYVLSRHAAWLEDAGGKLGIADVEQADAQARFKPVAQNGPGANFGLTRSAIWLRVRLQVQMPAQAATTGATPGEWLVEIAYPPLDRVDLYSPAPGGGWVQQSGGDSLPFASRAIAHRNHVMAVHLNPGANTLYLRLKSD
ncbi:MAG: hypothetical protein H7346_11685, partial [Burkholderiaceae bacterium]|nr:hypothetical protein [Burkholderiaceae bacterium]